MRMAEIEHVRAANSHALLVLRTAMLRQGLVLIYGGWVGIDGVAFTVTRPDGGAVDDADYARVGARWVVMGGDYGGVVQGSARRGVLILRG